MHNDNIYPDIYFIPEWGRAYEEHDKGEIEIFEFRSERGHVHYQYVKRPLPAELECPDYVDLVTPYGFSGPVVLACPSGNREALVAGFNEAFQDYCNRERIVSEYVRFNPWLKNHEDFVEFYELKYNNYTLFTDLAAGDFFKDEFSSKTRNQVRKAQKSGVRVEFDFEGTSVNEFSRLYERTAARNGFAEYYLFSEGFLRKTFSALAGRQFILNGLLDGACVSSAIFLIHDEFIHYHLCANDPRYYYASANSLLLFEAAQWGRDHGKKQLQLGGAFSKELFAFKKQFTNSKANDYFVGKRIRNREKYYELLDLKKKKVGIANPDYFPLYRG